MQKSSIAIAFAAAVAAAVALGAPSTASAQDADETITVNPFDLFEGFFNFEYETRLGPFLSGHIGVDTLVWEGVFDDRANETFAIGPTAGLRLFLFGGAPSGLWAGPFGGVLYVDAQTPNGEEQALGYHVGGMVGYTIIPLGIIALSAGIGVAYHDLSVEVGDDTFGVVGWSPRLRLAVGVAF